MNDITQVLERMQKGEPSAAEALLPLVYEELRKLAGHELVGLWHCPVCEQERQHWLAEQG